ncbi:hypothetical protein T07_11242 [Trichinella nelsoni]|uniref:EGF-like domain-containing protein n=1 Tax=Trichinella nelsoni TaxID=6336 RepID=A0A0V0RK37_9BILA|nr:hypothetical protein T07_11242 [Trichinella nelsoni]
MKSIAEALKGKSNAQLIGMNTESAFCFKYAPVTSAEVERSFTQLNTTAIKRQFEYDFNVNKFKYRNSKNVQWMAIGFELSKQRCQPGQRIRYHFICGYQERALRRFEIKVMLCNDDDPCNGRGNCLTYQNDKIAPIVCCKCKDKYFGTFCTERIPIGSFVKMTICLCSNCLIAIPHFEYHYKPTLLKALNSILYEFCCNRAFILIEDIKTQGSFLPFFVNWMQITVSYNKSELLTHVSELTIMKKFCGKVYFIYANTTDLHVEHLSDVHFHQLHHLKKLRIY